MRRSYKFRIYPTNGQINKAKLCLRDHRLLYNAALQERKGSWEWNRANISYYDQADQLKYIRDEDFNQQKWSATSQQATIRRLDRAFQAFYRRVRAGQTPGYPRFKSQDRWNSVEWPQEGNGCKWKPNENRVYFKGIGNIKVRAHRKVEGIVKTLTLIKEGKRWYLILSCDKVPKPAPTLVNNIIGIDVGVARFATTSDGEIVDNPRFFKQSLEELANAQRVFAKKKKGSNNRNRAKRKVAEVHRKTRNRRLDFHHKTARNFVKDNDVVVLEKLNINGMSRSAKGTVENPGTNVAAKSGLNKSILDAGWGQFANILLAKAEEAGRKVIFVNPQNTSKECNICKQKCERPQQDTVICPEHGPLDADLNAARNILDRAGLGSVWQALAC